MRLYTNLCDPLRITPRKIIIWVIFSFFSLSVFAQREQRQYVVKYIDEEIKVDGIIDEAAWQTAEVDGDFWQFFPADTTRSINPTEFRMLYDDHHIYVSVRAEAKTNNYVVNSLKRDFGGALNDNVTVMFDTFKDGTTAFLFGMTPYGVQREAFVSGGGADLNVSWDQKWVLESKIHDNYYILEASIPFSSIKFREGDTSWKFQIYRWDFQTNEQSAWGRVPRNQLLSNLAFMGNLVFEKPLGKPRTPIVVIPYVNALTSKDYIENQPGNNISVGGDAKVAIGNSMNLDITINPDFSNVEVDDIFTNLTRFEVFLPEKRQFFIENNDLFGSFGDRYNAAKPFFSRRIGLAYNKDGNLIENRILGGVRLSGKVNENLRLGFLNIQTGEDRINEIASNNNMMLVLQRKVFSRSNLGLFVVNREAFKNYEFLDPSEKFNRVVGAEYNMASLDNSWTGKFYLHKSFQPDDTKGNLSSQATVTYSHRKFEWIFDLMHVDKDFKADLGFIPRKDILKNGNGLTLKFYPKTGPVSWHGPGGMALYYWKPEKGLKQLDHTYNLNYNVNFSNQAVFTFDYNNEFVFLDRNFDPTYSGGIPLPKDRKYTYNQVGLNYTSNPAKLFSYTIQSAGGQFFLGNNFNIGSIVSYRIQPKAIMSLNVRYDNIRQPEPYSSVEYWLITPKAEITFTKNLFWSTMVQYSNQRKNLGINSRLQWRFAPLSDIYLVYNDNYFTEDFGPTFRSLNLKMTYWLNM